MQKHIKNYMKHFGYGEQDVILCTVCGKVATDIHHIVYRSAGGKDSVNNLIGLCRDCHDCSHFKKTPYLYPEELFERQKNLLLFS